MPVPLPSRFPFSPYPIGWYRVAWSADVRPGDVKPLCHFGVDLVLFRGAGGAPHVLDAHCPHVGAHLGYGGCVVDDTIQCPFHGWRMNGNGNCVIVPYADKVPPRAQVQSWPVREVNGAILVHYHPERAAPAWEPAVFDATDHPEWTRALHPHH